MLQVKKVIFILVLSILLSENTIQIQLGTLNTFSIPITLNYNLSENSSIHHINRLYHIDYPHYRYLHSGNIRDNITMISEISYFRYEKDNMLFKILLTEIAVFELSLASVSAIIRARASLITPSLSIDPSP